MVSVSTSQSPRWFALYTASHHEKHVSLQLQDRQVESYLPTYRTVRSWKNRTNVVLELPLFPSYVFVRIRPSDKTRVLSVPGALSLVGSRREAWPLPDFEIEALRAGVHQRKPEPHHYLTVGERARIKSGALAGMEGILLAKRNGFRVVLSLEQIMRGVSVEVELNELERACPKKGLAS
jgi:transcription antitermination factor NusG